MCTAILSLEPGAPVLLAGFRDELTDRAWQPPQRHWPGSPELIGGRDLLAGGTWLAVAPAARRAACVLNGRGTMAPARSRRSRGVLPLQAAAEGKLVHAGLEDFDPFHLLVAEPGRAALASWDGQDLTERELPAGLHMIVNSGLDSDLLPTGTTGTTGTGGAGAAESAGREHELARITHFLSRLRGVPRPAPRPEDPVARAWGDWLPLLDGDGIAPDDPRALVVRRDLPDGRVWGTTSTSLVALWPDAVRYDFTGAPGDAAAWRPVPTA
jgi:transport and Golgi organization protein 2